MANGPNLYQLRRSIHLVKGFPTIVTLCGSTRFAEEYIRENRTLTLNGHIVISVGLFGHQEGTAVMEGDAKILLDRLHLRKIDLADAIYVINKDDYIGESTKKEIAYAKETGKVVLYMEPHEEQDRGHNG